MPCSHHTPPTDVSEWAKGRGLARLPAAVPLAGMRRFLAEQEAIASTFLSAPPQDGELFPGSSKVDVVELMCERKLPEELEKLDRQGKLKQAMKLLKKHPDFLLWHMRTTKSLFTYNLLSYAPFQAAYGARMG